MRPTTLYRIAAVLLLLFACGHTAGFLSFKPSSPEGLAALSAMNSVAFDFEGNNRTYGGFYVGFGLTVTVEQIVDRGSLSWLRVRCGRLPGTAAAVA